jgi:two-component system sensor histidine kinase KdpD
MAQTDFAVKIAAYTCLPSLKIDFGAQQTVKDSKLHTIRMDAMVVVRVFICMMFVAALTWATFVLLHVNALIAALAYVLAVLVVAARWGLVESLATSVAAMLCLNYFFLPSILSLTIADPQNWVALFVFMVTSVTASQLSASVRNKAAEALARRIEVERLYQLGLSLMLVDTTRELGPQITAAIKEVFGFSEVAFCDGLMARVHVSGLEDPRLDVEMLCSVATGSASWFVSRKPTREDGVEVIAVPVALGGRILGSLGAVGPSPSEPAVQAIANLAAVGIEHARQQIAFGKLEVVRQNERLRSILLDAVAHDFLTPLTSIKSAVTTVRSEYRHEVGEDEFLSVVEEETDKLAEMISELTDMARIEPGKARIRRRELAVADIVRSTLNRMRSVLDGRQVELRIQENISPVYADPEMLGLALRQLLGNGSKYSPPEASIELGASEAAGVVTMWVRDHGLGVPPNEFESIFERFYRGKQAQASVAGTGMGLSIARDIINAHHGKLWVNNVPDGGAIFSFEVPVFRGAEHP